MNLQYQYEDSDVLNVAVTGAKIRNLSSEIANLTNQLQELNNVCTNSHPHTQHSRSIAYRKHCMENFILWFIYQHCAYIT